MGVLAQLTFGSIVLGQHQQQVKPFISCYATIAMLGKVYIMKE